MNHDDHKPDMQTWIEPGLEARVVAWVSGEASAFEAAELERLTGEKPELAIFKRRIEAVRGLVAEALRPDPQPLLLSPDRRAKLLQAIGATDQSATPQKAGAPVVLPLATARQRDRNFRRWILAAAACLTLGLFVAMTIPAFQKTRSYEAKIGSDKSIASFELAMPVDLPSSEDGKNADGTMHNPRQLAGRESAMKAAVSAAGKRKAEAEARENAQTSAAGHARLRGVSDQFRPGPVPSRGSLASLSAPAAPQEPADFSPMVVTPDVDFNSGYTASNTLAGTRLRTDLADLGSSISVTTKQFLQDTGAMNSKDTLDYASITEVAGNRGNFAARDELKLSAGAAADPNQAAVGATYDYIAPPSVGSKTWGVTLDKFKRPMSSGGVPLNGVDGQTGAASSDNETVVLSPFEVVSAKDDGNKASGAIVSTRPTVRDPALALEKLDKGKKEADEPVSPPAKPAPAEIEVPEVSAAQEPVSTFSLHVSDVSFRLAQAALARGEEPDEASIRPEEFYNAFNYGDPAPAISEKIGCRIEQAAHPVVQQRNLVRIALRVAATGRGAGQPLRLTVLLDTSGSMEREDRAAAVHRALEVLTSLLGPNDRVTLIGFARRPSLLAEELAGDKAGQLLDIIAGTPAEGGTNLEEALKLGGELARRHLDPAAQNRIVLLTDGAANLGNADPAQLAQSVEALRQQGISFDACGVGNTGIDDAVLEALTRKGGGRYYVLDSPEAADAGFARQLAGAFRPAAENVKVQVRFNPARVGNYRLIGFEQHRLNEADFRNDKVQAAELAAEEAAVALYQVQVLPEGEGELGEVYVRFRDVATGAMVERSWTLAFDPRAPAFDRASPAMQLTGASALLAEKLRGGEAADTINLKDLAGVMNTLRGHYAEEARVQELVTMFNQARRMSGE